MTIKPYMRDCYRKSFSATVTAVNDGKFVELSSSFFYPTSGGQPHDIGTMTTPDGREVSVIYVGSFEGKQSHQVEPEGLLREGDQVDCVIDWDRRYRLMRMHTAAHVISSVFEKKKGALITGNSLGIEKSRIDYKLDDYDREELESFVNDVNEIIKKDIPIKSHFLSREEAEEMLERISTLAVGFPEYIKEVRVLDIEGVDAQACGGTHLKSTGEIQGVQFLKFENKGKNNRRLHFTVLD